MTDPSMHPVAVLGAGPAGMATALALIKAGHRVRIYERYREARPAGNILNLWPPPIKALREMGVDTNDLGAPCHSTFRSARNGKVRADIEIPPSVVDEFGGGFIGMIRPDLYRRMLAALPEDTIEFARDVAAIDDHGDGITLSFTDGTSVETPVLIGADGIDSIVRRTLWGDSPKREHNLGIIGGYIFETDFPGIEPGECIVSHNRTVQGSYTAIRMDGVYGYQWWMLRAWDDSAPHPDDLHEVAVELAEGFPDPLPSIIAATPPEQIQRWQIRDRKPLKSWSKGRITLAGDAAHATSPYAAYGAGMSICDGYFLGQHLAGIDLHDTAAVAAALVAYETPRIPHTTSQVQSAYVLGQMFHHCPAPLRPLRDLVMDHTPLLQKQVGERNPREIVAQLDEMGSGILSPAG